MDVTSTSQPALATATGSCDTPGNNNPNPGNNNNTGNSDTGNSNSSNIAEWDVARKVQLDTPDNRDSFMWALKAIKLLIYLVLSCVILSCLTLSQVSLVFMTSKIKHSNSTNSSSSDEVIDDRNKATTELMISLAAPHTLMFIIWTVKAIFGGQKWPNCGILFMMLLMELLHTSGLCTLVYIILPQLGFVRAVLILSCSGSVPVLLKLVFGYSPQFEAQSKTSISLHHTDSSVMLRGSALQPTAHRCNTLLRVLWYTANSLAFCTQVGTLVYIMVAPPTDETAANLQTLATSNHISCKLLPLALIAVSVKWMENFVDKDVRIGRFTLPLHRWKRMMHSSRQKVTSLTSVLSLAIIISFPFIIHDTFYFSIHQLVDDARENLINISPVIMQCLSGPVCYMFSVVACSLCMQTVSFSLPLLLATPVTIGLTMLHCTNNVCMHPLEALVWSSTRRDNLTHTPHTDLVMTTSVVSADLYLLVASWVAMIIICGHIWFPRQNVLESAQKLFVTPGYCGVLLGKSLMLNRRRRDKEVDHSSTEFHWTKCQYYLNTGRMLRTLSRQQSRQESLLLNNFDNADATAVDEPGGPSMLRSPSQIDQAMGAAGGSDRQIPTVYACATLWHETYQEMTQLMKSLFRLDRNQNTRINSMRRFNVDSPNNYRLQVHILFDDAWETVSSPGATDGQPNSYVQQLLSCINPAGSSVYKSDITVGDPMRLSTPYGGRLVFELPGGTSMVVHLKDKNRIRHRKRWSQVMYMYYLLGYKLSSYSNVLKFGSKTYLDFLRRKSENIYLLALDGDVDFTPSALRHLIDRMRKNNNVGAACGRIHPIGNGPVLWYQQFEYAIAHWLQKATEHVLGCVLCSPGCFSLFRGSALLADNVMKTYSKKANRPSEYVQYDQGEDRWLCTLLLKAGYKIEYCAASDALTYAPETFNEFYNQRRRWAPSTMANMLDLLMNRKITVTNNSNISSPYMMYQLLLFASSIIAPGTIILCISAALQLIFYNLSVATLFIIVLLPVMCYIYICMTATQKTQLKVGAVMTVFYSVVMTISCVGTLITFLSYSIYNPNVIFFVCLIGVFLIAGILHPREFSCLTTAPLFFLCVPSGYLLLMIYSLCNINVVSWGTRENATAEQKSQQKLNRKEQRSGMLGCINVKKFVQNIKDTLTDIGIANFAKQTPHVEENVAKEELKTSGEKVETGKSEPEETREAGTQDQVEDMSSAQTASLASTRCDWKRNAINLSPKEEQFWNDLIAKYLYPLEADAKQQKQDAKDLRVLRNHAVFAFCLLNFLWMTCFFVMQYLGENSDIKNTVYVPIPSGKDFAPEYFEPLSLGFVVVFSCIILLQICATLVHRTGTLFHLIATTHIFRNKDDIEETIEAIDQDRTLEHINEDTNTRIRSTSSSARINAAQRQSSSNILDEEFDRRTSQTPIMQHLRMRNVEDELTVNTL